MKKDVALTRDRLETLDRELAVCEKVCYVLIQTSSVYGVYVYVFSLEEECVCVCIFSCICVCIVFG